VVAFSHYACESTRNLADVILPIAALPEIEATLVNLDGQAQRTQPGGKPPGDAREGWRVLRALGGELQLAGFDFTDLAGARASIDNAARALPAIVPGGQTRSDDGNGLEVAATPGIYRTDAVVRRATALQAHPLNTAPCITLNPVDAAAAGVAHGAVAKVSAADGTATLPVIVSRHVAPGVAWIESGHGATSPLGAGRVKVVAA
jgi:NADH-quinone oxidoreductase subunit G